MTAVEDPEEIIQLKRPRVEVPPPSNAPPPCVVTVVQTAYHQSSSGAVVSEDSRISRVLASDEQPYVRRTRVSEEWTPVSTDWVRDPGLVVVRNEGTQFRVNPTPEEAESARQRVVVVGLRVGSGAPVPFARVRPGEQLIVEPVEVGQWSIRCEFGAVPITLAAYPR